MNKSAKLKQLVEGMMDKVPAEETQKPRTEPSIKPQPQLQAKVSGKDPAEPKEFNHGIYSPLTKAEDILAAVDKESKEKAKLRGDMDAETKQQALNKEV